MGEDPAPQSVLDLEELQIPGVRQAGRRHILSILVENKPGVLARISGLFSRRGFNIDTLAVGPTDDPRISRITLTVEVTGTDDKIEAFEELVRPYGLIEMVRTGEIAVARGRSTT